MESKNPLCVQIACSVLSTALLWGRAKQLSNGVLREKQPGSMCMARLEGCTIPRIGQLHSTPYFTKENIQGYLLLYNHKQFESQFIHLHKRITWKLYSSRYTLAAALIAVKFQLHLLLQTSKLSKAQSYYCNRRDQRPCSRCLSSCSCPISAQTMHSWLWKGLQK